MSELNRNDGRRSSFTGPGGRVAVTRLGDGSISISDTKNRAQPPLVFTTDEWAAFLRSAKAGEFDFGPGPTPAGRDVEATVRLKI